MNIYASHAERSFLASAETSVYNYTCKILWGVKLFYGIGKVVIGVSSGKYTSHKRQHFTQVKSVWRPNYAARHRKFEEDHLSSSFQYAVNFF